tara:strand:- start:1453 stop:2061 length:609 start_codon:yes stop_codon:yes gene_type:complete
MLDLANDLERKPILYTLNNHQKKSLNQFEQNQWQKWKSEALSWVENFDSSTDLLAYSISAPLILSALKETNTTINKLILVSPAFYPRFQKISTGLLDILPKNFLIPSFNKKSDRCNSWVSAELYREIFEQLLPPQDKMAKSCLLLIHRYDEILDSSKTLAWGKKHGCEVIELNSPLTPPFHATYKSKRLPIKTISDYLKSTI